MSTSQLPIGVVGAGIIGLAVARRLQQVYPHDEVVVLDKEREVAAHQTGHNSGVVHAGLYYPPGSLKAELCRRGGELLRAYTADRGLPFDSCGKIVVAKDDAELAALDDIHRRAEANRVPGLRRLTARELRDVEPHAVGVAALHSPATAITDYGAISHSLAADVQAGGGTVRLAVAAERVTRGTGGVDVVTAAGERLRFRHVVLCAGLQSDRLAVAAGDRRDPVIVPFRGEYLTLRPARADLVRGLIYPVPDPNYPFLGVHFTRRVDGRVDVGPNAVLATAREGYRRRDFSRNDLRATFAHPGFRRLARQHWRKGVSEIVGSASVAVFVKRARAYVPELEVRDVIRGGAGVRAQAVDDMGGLVDDFRITHLDRITAVRNAPSPAATAALAIAEYIVERADLAD